eukprot:TRINITY_DN33459_c0_g1_i1.p1 TRINITY_DN33459_c0_g1~~TRINITY_DN33459_c0_g1_i1.p1  ORF type:complete len:363 (+),score=69.56 TRINITY_DN33459_c0_g1_i1:63-1091(+)
MVKRTANGSVTPVPPAKLAKGASRAGGETTSFKARANCSVALVGDAVPDQSLDPAPKRRRLLGKTSVAAPSEFAEKVVVSASSPTASKASQERPARKKAAIAVLPPAFVVNLDRRPDRWAAVKKRLREFDGLVFDRVPAVDAAAGIEIPASDVAHHWTTANNWKYVTQRFEGGENCGYEKCTLPLSGGERGCAASHIALWRICAANEEAGPQLILEDDALPLPGFVSRFQRALRDLQAEAPDILYLGYELGSPLGRKVSRAVREATYLWTTVAYVIWPSGARKLLAALPVDQPVDNFMASLIATGKLHGFAVTPEAVRQAGEWNVDSDIKHSDDLAWVQNRK